MQLRSRLDLVLRYQVETCSSCATVYQAHLRFHILFGLLFLCAWNEDFLWNFEWNFAPSAWPTSCVGEAERGTQMRRRFSFVEKSPTFRRAKWGIMKGEHVKSRVGKENNPNPSQTQKQRLIFCQMTWPLLVKALKKNTAVLLWRDGKIRGLSIAPYRQVAKLPYDW